MIISIKDLHVDVEGTEILHGVSLDIELGKTYAIMGTNASGKSTLAKVLMGDPDYNVKKGEILFYYGGKAVNLLEKEPYERACMGLFLAFQYPAELPGVTTRALIRESFNSICRFQGVPTLDPVAFDSLLNKKVEQLGFDKVYLDRYANVDFSGGEKKRNEILQMAVLNPKVAILDEIDSGLDVDALKMVGKGLATLNTTRNTLILITHYERILQYVHPDVVHVLLEGKVVKSGGIEIAQRIEKEGYDWCY